MPSKKDYQEKLFAQFQLSERVPKNNFYRKLNEVLDLRFLYKKTRNQLRLQLEEIPKIHHQKSEGKWKESRFCFSDFIRVVHSSNKRF